MGRCQRLVFVSLSVICFHVIFFVSGAGRGKYPVPFGYQGKEIKRSKELYRQDTGEVMMASSEGNPEEHKKIAGDYLYLLGKKGDSLCVNKYSLKELFLD